jgi:hypothetical protein
MIFGEDEEKKFEAGYDQEINITTSMGRNDGFTLKKTRDNRTDETPRPHSNTPLFLVLVKSYTSRITSHH